MGVSENELSHHFQLKSISWRFPKSWGYPLNHPCYVQIFHYKPTILIIYGPPHLQRCPGTNCGKSSSNPLSNCCTSGRRAINPCRWCVFSARHREELRPQGRLLLSSDMQMDAIPCRIHDHHGHHGYVKDCTYMDTWPSPNEMNLKWNADWKTLRDHWRPEAFRATKR